MQTTISFLPPDDRALKSHETVEGTARFWSRLCGGDAVAGLKAMGLVDLADRSVRFLSAGQRRRLSLARVISSGANLWLLDEPLNALDAVAAEMFAQALSRHLSRGGSAVIAGHHVFPGARVVDLGGFA